MKNTEKIKAYYNQEVNAFAFLKLLDGEQNIRVELHIPVVGVYRYEGTKAQVMDELDASIAENEYIHIVKMTIENGVPVFTAYSR